MIYFIILRLKMCNIRLPQLKWYFSLEVGLLLNFNPHLC